LQHGADNYVKQWSASAIGLGLDKAPQSVKELEDEIARFMREELSYTQKTKEVVEFILNPPFDFFAMFFFRPLAKTAVRSLSSAERSLLRLKNPNKVWELIARFNLWGLQKALGSHSPAQEAALARYKKLGK
jgi:hypothetical protein